MAIHVTNPREALTDESESDTWTSQGSMGPPELQLIRKLGMHGGVTSGPTCQSPGESTGHHVARGLRPNHGLAEPTLIRLILALHMAAPDWSPAATLRILEHFAPRSKPPLCL